MEGGGAAAGGANGEQWNGAHLNIERTILGTFCFIHSRVHMLYTACVRHISTFVFNPFTVTLVVGRSTCDSSSVQQQVS